MVMEGLLRSQHLLFAMMLPLTVGAQGRASSPSVTISGDTAAAACSASIAVVEIQAWFVALSAGDTAHLRRLATPAMAVFSAGRNGLPEPFARADNVDQLVEYATTRHRVGDRWTLLEVHFELVQGDTLGFTPITFRASHDVRATQGYWLGKAGFLCGRGVQVLNLAPWPSNIPPPLAFGMAQHLLIFRRTAAISATLPCWLHEWLR
jgi:hypothetical protein